MALWTRKEYLNYTGEIIRNAINEIEQAILAGDKEEEKKWTKRLSRLNRDYDNCLNGRGYWEAVR